MKNISTFYITVFLIILTFSTPFISYAQQVSDDGEKTIISEQETNTEFEKLIATATADAKRDVKVDFGNREQLSWLSVGFTCSVLGVASAYFQKAQPPPVRLLGKPPAYVLIYGNTYEYELRKNRMVFAGSGCAVSLVLLAVFLLNDASDINTSSNTRTSWDSALNDSLEDACLGCLSLLDLVNFASSCLLSNSSADCLSPGDCLY